MKDEIKTKTGEVRKFMTLKAYAEYRKSSFSYLKKLMATNDPRLVIRNYKVDVRETDRLLELSHDRTAELDAIAKEKLKADGEYEYRKLDPAEVRRMRDYYAAQRERLKYEDEKNLLVDKEQVQDLVFSTFRALRDRFLALPARLRPRIQGLTPHDQEILIMDEVKKILSSVADTEFFTFRESE